MNGRRQETGAGTTVNEPLTRPVACPVRGAICQLAVHQGGIDTTTAIPNRLKPFTAGQGNDIDGDCDSDNDCDSVEGGYECPPLHVR